MGNIYQRGDRWYIQFRVNGRLIRESAGDTKGAAQTLLGVRQSEAKEDQERFRLGIPRACRTTFDGLTPGFLEWSRANKRSWRNDELLVKPLSMAFGVMLLTDITEARVIAYQNDRLKALSRHGKPMSPPSVNREIALLRKMLSFAVKLGKLDRNHLLRVKMFKESPARKPVLELEDEARLLSECSPWLASLVSLALGSGLRQGEALALRWRDVDWTSGAFAVVDSKSGDSRTVQVHPRVIDELRARRGVGEAFVVVMPSGEAPKPQSITRAFKRAATRAGFGHLRFHDLRHVAAQRLLEAGASLPELAQWLGHRSLDMVQRYTNPNPKRLRSLVANMEMSTHD